MRRLLCLLSLFCISAITVWGQDITVNGRVINEASGKPLEGISVTLKGTDRGTSTNEDGQFSIQAPGNGTLVFSGIGFGQLEKAINNASQVEIRLKETAGQLDAVVVTALGVQRQKKSLGYATQQISNDDLAIGRENNVANALQGRAAGVVINRTSGGPGSSSRISLRGERSLNTGATANQPLIVIDGVPVDNTVRGGAAEFGGSDGGDAIGNLNPDDIESMNILRGPNAAALYGARANNGVLVITTKKGRKQKGLGITYNLNTSMDEPSYKVKLQDQYAQGNAIGTYSPTNEESWGPKIAGQTITNWKGEEFPAAAQDHVSALLERGLNVNNNVSLSTGSDKAQLRLSYGNQYAKGMIPTNTQNKNTILLRGTSDLGKLNIDLKVNYINQVIKGRPTGGEEALNPYSDLLRMPTTVRNSDLIDYIDNTGTLPRSNFFLPNSSLIVNPYWIINKVVPNEVRNRIIASGSVRYNLMKGMNLTGRVGIDRYNDDNDRRVYSGTPTAFTSTSTGGQYSYDRYNVTELNMDAFLDYTTDLSDNFSLNALLGTSVRKNKVQSATAGAGGLDIPDLFIISNGRAISGTSSLTKQELQSIYGTAQIGYRNAIFLDLTGRNDWASTLPSQNRSYFYPSASLSAVISDLADLPSWINYLKLRSSYAFVGKDATPYSLAQTLVADVGVAGTILRNRAVLVNPNLKPEQTRALELGTEMAFLGSRLTVDFTYYNTASINQIINLPLPFSSGFTSRAINAGEIRNKGIELLLTGKILKNPAGINWNMSLNFSRNRNKVEELDPQQKTFLLGSTRIGDLKADEGTRIGEMFVRSFQRDEEGLVQIGANGLPLVTGRTYYAGNVFPDWTGGINNAFSYKNWSLDFLVDARVGGIVASHTQAVLAGLGKLPQTLEGRENNDLVVEGVLAGTKTPNNIAVNPRSYWQAIGGRANPIGEAWVYDATAIRLRQLTLGFKLPQRFSNKLKMNAIDLSLYGRNLFFFYKDAPFDPEVALSSALNGQGVDFYSLPTARSYGVNLTVSF
jgi:TonB-linked SusC/RagA family outer membrane protein